MQCGKRAVLIVTTAVKGTASNVAKERVELRCTEAEGHDGPHRDAAHGEQWEADQNAVTTLLRHEDDAD